MKREQTDVLIVGAGPAGLAAAVELKKLGAGKVTVVDREPEAGGTPRLCHHVGFGIRDLHRVYAGPQYARRNVAQAAASGAIIRPATTITGWGNGRTLTYSSPDGLGEIKAQAILLATGVRERPRTARLVPGKRVQGVFTTGSLQRFVDQYQLPVGHRAVIVGAELVSLSAFMTLKKAGLDVAMMTTELPQHQIYFPYVPMKWLTMDLLNRVPVRPLSRVTRIFGRKRVEGVEIRRLDTGEVETAACDAVVFTGDWIPEYEMARSGELTLDGGTRGPQVDGQFRTSRTGVFAAGNLLHGAETADMCALEGRSAAQSIHDFLQNGRWPAASLPIQCAAPIQWAAPNRVTAGEKAGELAFYVGEFRQNALVEIRQGGKVLYGRRYGRLRPNHVMRLRGDWAAGIDFGGAPLEIGLAG